MTDKERCEDDVLKNCIQEAYGISDEQLLAELDEIEATLSDDEFVGVEDRIYEKIVEKEGITFSHEPTPTKTVFTGKFSKRKKWLIVGLAATFVVGVGINTIGSNNYFLQQRNKPDGIVLNSGQNIIKNGNLKDAYNMIEEQLDISIIRMNYIPQGVEFEQLEVYSNHAILTFKYEEEFFYMILAQKTSESSISVESDRQDKGINIYNEWLSQEIVIEENPLEDGSVEYSAIINQEDVNCRIIGKLPNEEIVKIVEKLSY